MIYISFDIGVKNLAMCILRKTDVITVIDWRIIVLAEAKKDIKGIEDISERIYLEMDNVVGDLKAKGIDRIDYVLIENQPSNLNGIMKTIQHIIYGYFNLIKHWDKEVDNVILVNASLKTKTHSYNPDIQIKPSKARGGKGTKALLTAQITEETDVNEEQATEVTEAPVAPVAPVTQAAQGTKNVKGFRRDKYKLNKQLSIEICKEYIKDNEYLSALFAENKKKDDLSDACLQAVAYIRNNIKETAKAKEEALEKYNKLYN
jgi:hypothetical protein